MSDLERLLYVAYFQCFGRESVCNHPEMVQVIAEAKVTAKEDLMLDEEDDDFEDEFVDVAVTLMHARVGQPGPKRSSGHPVMSDHYYSLPWGDGEIFPVVS